MKAFEILIEAHDIPRDEHRLNFQESLHKTMVSGEEPPVFEESSDDDKEEKVAKKRLRPMTSISLPSRT